MFLVNSSRERKINVQLLMIAQEIVRLQLFNIQVSWMFCLLIFAYFTNQSGNNYICCVQLKKSFFVCMRYLFSVSKYFKPEAGSLTCTCGNCFIHQFWHWKTQPGPKTDTQYRLSSKNAYKQINKSSQFLIQLLWNISSRHTGRTQILTTVEKTTIEKLS